MEMLQRTIRPKCGRLPVKRPEARGWVIRARAVGQPSVHRVFFLRELDSRE